MRIYIAFLGIVCLLFSCTNTENEIPETPSKDNWQKAAVAYLASEPDLISFGTIRVDQMLKKALYDSKLSESGLVPLDMIKDYSKVIYTELPMFYAVKSYLKDITSPEVVLVCKIKSASLAVETMKKDFQIGEIIEENGVKFLFTSDLKIGLTDNEMIVFMSEKNDNERAQTAIENTIDGLKSKKTNSEIAKAIGAREDFTFALNVAQIQRSISSLMSNKDVESNKIVKGTVALHVSFEKGRIVLTNKNYLPKELTASNLFAKNSKEMLNKLGAGSPIAAITLAIDMKGVEKFQKQYLPKSISNSIQDSNLDPDIKNLVPRELSVIEALLQKDGLQEYTDGNLAYGEYLIDGKYTEYSAYMGIGPGLEEVLKNEFYPITGFLHSLKIDETQIALYSSEQNGPQNNTNTLQLRPQFKDLGKKPISAFFDIERHPYKELLINNKTSERIVGLLKHFTLNADLSEGKLIITMKDEQTNAMTQIANLIPSIVLGSIFQ
jgi:hypothetical protein